MGEQRQALLQQVRTVVVKVGTTVLTGASGRLDRDRIVLLAREVAGLRERGLRVAVVSSGAIGAGMGELGLEHRPDTLPQLQAAAAVGQGQLMRAYDEAFKGHGLRTGQVLLTGDDLNNRLRYLNARYTLFALLDDFGVVPIINENDTTSVDEIAFGDNDFLAAQVTNLLQAELLIILTATDGLRRLATDGGLGERIDVVAEVTDEVLALASGEGTALGRGGMASKLQAARIAARSGEAVIIADGRQAGVLAAVFAAEPVGTLFLPSARRMASRKSWIATVRPKGRVRVDEGARRALVEQGRSLLPSGVVEVRGRFQRGDVVELEDGSGRVFGRGLTNYSSEEVAQVRGRKTSEIAAVLGAKPYDEVVHRNHMVILEGRSAPGSRRDGP